MTENNGRTDGSRPLGRWDDWVRWLVGGLIAGSIAWAGIGARLAAVETRLAFGEERASEDRKLMRDQLDGLRVEISHLREQLIRQDAIARAHGAP